MRPGVRLGVDVGSVRIGVARSDPDGLLATPLVTLRRGSGDLAALAELAVEHQAVEIVVGLPVTLRDQRGTAAQSATAFAARLARRLAATTPVRLVDERLSTVAAQRGLRESGVDTRGGRKVIDQAAAVIILQSALDGERATGVAPGQVVGAGADGAAGAGGTGTAAKVEE